VKTFYNLKKERVNGTWRLFAASFRTDSMTYVCICARFAFSVLY